MIVVSILFIIDFTKTDYQIIQDNSTQESLLLPESQKEIKLDNEKRLQLISDIRGDLHYFLLDGKSLVTTRIIGNLLNFDNGIYERDVYWTYFSEPGKYALLVGTIVNENIEYITVNNMGNDDINYFMYNGYKVFYSESVLETPILITGYTKENNMVYKNYLESGGTWPPTTKSSLEAVSEYVYNRSEKHRTNVF